MAATTLKVWSLSLGCPKNRVDTEHLLGSLGVNIEAQLTPKTAELLVLNTCAFIESAVRESVRAILDAIEELKGVQPKPLFVVCGCLVGRYGQEALAIDLPEVDLFLSPKEQELWPDKLAAKLGLAKPLLGRLLSTGPSYGWLKIGEGCKHRCAFCTIPAIRGPLKSVSKQTLVSEAMSLLGQGVRELICVAQDVTSWGTESEDSLKDLLTSLINLPNLLWLRLLYLYPAGLSEDLLRFIGEADLPLLPYFDIPLQHSHPQILQTMGRPFAQDPRYILDKVRKYVPNAVLRTTFIVGYPGETEAHFAHLCKFVEEQRFLHVGVFAYEQEEGTSAALLPNQIAQEIKSARLDELLSLQQGISAELLADYLGDELDVLVDSVNSEWPGLHNGRVWFQAPEVDGQTYVSGPNVAPGKVVRADIVETATYDLTALA
ncbi:MAG: 30S ribosomal protein S12 methylthiotransferase RimO [Desulfovibrionaceae bacterium]|nr:30S ribosomal protein S12 methylthiotransferase RimO [Desulfovibrionaceae bacterium]